MTSKSKRKNKNKKVNSTNQSISQSPSATIDENTSPGKVQQQQHQQQHLNGQQVKPKVLQFDEQQQFKIQQKQKIKQTKQLLNENKQKLLKVQSQIKEFISIDAQQKFSLIEVENHEQKQQIARIVGENDQNLIQNKIEHSRSKDQPIIISESVDNQVIQKIEVLKEQESSKEQQIVEQDKYINQNANKEKISDLVQSNDKQQANMIQLTEQITRKQPFQSSVVQQNHLQKSQQQTTPLKKQISQQKPQSKVNQHPIATIQKKQSNEQTVGIKDNVETTDKQPNQIFPLIVEIQQKQVKQQHNDTKGQQQVQNNLQTQTIEQSYLHQQPIKQKIQPCQKPKPQDDILLQLKSSLLQSKDNFHSRRLRERKDNNQNSQHQSYFNNPSILQNSQQFIEHLSADLDNYIVIDDSQTSPSNTGYEQLQRSITTQSKLCQEIEISMIQSRTYNDKEEKQQQSNQEGCGQVKEQHQRKQIVMTSIPQEETSQETIKQQHDNVIVEDKQPLSEIQVQIQHQLQLQLQPSRQQTQIIKQKESQPLIQPIATSLSQNVQIPQSSLLQQQSSNISISTSNNVFLSVKKSSTQSQVNGSIKLYQTQSQVIVDVQQSQDQQQLGINILNVKGYSEYNTIEQTNVQQQGQGDNDNHQNNKEQKNKDEKNNNRNKQQNVQQTNLSALIDQQLRISASSQQLKQSNRQFNLSVIRQSQSQQLASSYDNIPSPSQKIRNIQQSIKNDSNQEDQTLNNLQGNNQTAIMNTTNNSSYLKKTQSHCFGQSQKGPIQENLTNNVQQLKQQLRNLVSSSISHEQQSQSSMQTSCKLVESTYVVLNKRNNVQQQGKQQQQDKQLDRQKQINQPSNNQTPQQVIIKHDQSLILQLRQSKFQNQNQEYSSKDPLVVNQLAITIVKLQQQQNQSNINNLSQSETLLNLHDHSNVQEYQYQQDHLQEQDQDQLQDNKIVQQKQYKKQQIQQVQQLQRPQNTQKYQQEQIHLSEQNTQITNQQGQIKANQLILPTTQYLPTTQQLKISTVQITIPNQLQQTTNTNKKQQQDQKDKNNNESQSKIMDNNAQLEDVNQNHNKYKEQQQTDSKQKQQHPIVNLSRSIEVEQNIYNQTQPHQQPITLQQHITSPSDDNTISNQQQQSYQKYLHHHQTQQPQPSPKQPSSSIINNKSQQVKKFFQLHSKIVEQKQVQYLKQQQQQLQQYKQQQQREYQQQQREQQQQLQDEIIIVPEQIHIYSKRDNLQVSAVQVEVQSSGSKIQVQVELQSSQSKHSSQPSHHQSQQLIIPPQITIYEEYYHSNYPSSSTNNYHKDEQQEYSTYQQLEQHMIPSVQQIKQASPVKIIPLSYTLSTMMNAHHDDHLVAVVKEQTRKNKDEGPQNIILQIQPIHNTFDQDEEDMHDPHNSPRDQEQSLQVSQNESVHVQFRENNNNQKQQKEQYQHPQQFRIHHLHGRTHLVHQKQDLSKLFSPISYQQAYLNNQPASLNSQHHMQQSLVHSYHHSNHSTQLNPSFLIQKLNQIAQHPIHHLQHAHHMNKHIQLSGSNKNITNIDPISNNLSNQHLSLQPQLDQTSDIFLNRFQQVKTQHLITEQLIQPVSNQFCTNQKECINQLQNKKIRHNHQNIQQSQILFNKKNNDGSNELIDFVKDQKSQQYIVVPQQSIIEKQSFQIKPQSLQINALSNQRNQIKQPEYKFITTTYTTQRQDDGYTRIANVQPHLQDISSYNDQSNQFSNNNRNQGFNNDHYYEPLTNTLSNKKRNIRSTIIDSLLDQMEQQPNHEHQLKETSQFSDQIRQSPSYQPYQNNQYPYQYQPLSINIQQSSSPRQQSYYRKNSNDIYSSINSSPFTNKSYNINTYIPNTQSNYSPVTTINKPSQKYRQFINDNSAQKQFNQIRQAIESYEWNNSKSNDKNQQQRKQQQKKKQQIKPFNAVSSNHPIRQNQTTNNTIIPQTPNKVQIQQNISDQPKPMTIEEFNKKYKYNNFTSLSVKKQSSRQQPNNQVDTKIIQVQNKQSYILRKQPPVTNQKDVSPSLTITKQQQQVAYMRTTQTKQNTITKPVEQIISSYNNNPIKELIQNPPVKQTISGQTLRDIKQKDTNLNNQIKSDNVSKPQLLINNKQKNQPNIIQQTQNNINVRQSSYSLINPSNYIVYHQDKLNITPSQSLPSQQPYPIKAIINANYSLNQTDPFKSKFTIGSVENSYNFTNAYNDKPKHNQQQSFQTTSLFPYQENNNKSSAYSPPKNIRPFTHQINVSPSPVSSINPLTTFSPYTNKFDKTQSISQNPYSFTYQNTLETKQLTKDNQYDNGLIYNNNNRSKNNNITTNKFINFSKQNNQYKQQLPHSSYLINKLNSNSNNNNNYAFQTGSKRQGIDSKSKEKQHLSSFSANKQQNIIQNRFLNITPRNPYKQIFLQQQRSAQSTYNNNKPYQQTHGFSVNKQVESKYYNRQPQLQKHIHSNAQKGGNQLQQPTYDRKISNSRGKKQKICLTLRRDYLPESKINYNKTQNQLKQLNQPIKNKQSYQQKQQHNISNNNNNMSYQSHKANDNLSPYPNQVTKIKQVKLSRDNIKGENKRLVNLKAINIIDSNNKEYTEKKFGEISKKQIENNLSNKRQNSKIKQKQKINLRTSNQRYQSENQQKMVDCTMEGNQTFTKLFSFMPNPINSEINNEQHEQQEQINKTKQINLKHLNSNNKPLVSPIKSLSKGNQLYPNASPLIGKIKYLKTEQSSSKQVVYPSQNNPTTGFKEPTQKSFNQKEPYIWKDFKGLVKQKIGGGNKNEKIQIQGKNFLQKYSNLNREDSLSDIQNEDLIS